MIPNGMRMRAATAKARARGFILSGAERPHLSERATVHSLTCSKDRSWLTCAALRIHTFASSLVVEVPCELLATCLVAQPQRNAPTLRIRPLRQGSQRGGTPSGAPQKGRIAWLTTSVNHSVLGHERARPLGRLIKPWFGLSEPARRARSRAWRPQLTAGSAGTSAWCTAGLCGRA